MVPPPLLFPVIRHLSPDFVNTDTSAQRKGDGGVQHAAGLGNKAAWGITAKHDGLL